MESGDDGERRHGGGEFKLGFIIDIQTAQYSCRDEVLLFSVPITIISDFKHSKSCSSHLLDPCFLPPLTLPDLHKILGSAAAKQRANHPYALLESLANGRGK